ncbi:hypothetical protein NKI51_27755 [Mesorhizobium australicum]|uniref:hypothetical protein n=1 Tax=Mesorhizobium australicum TaxID=536018 RepID=UPI0033394BC2
MRHACLDGVRLVSDRQPTRLRVDEHTSGTPAIWLRPDGSSMAWMWQAHAKPAPPCQCLEEAMVEAFSLRGLRRLRKTGSRTRPSPATTPMRSTT